MSVKILAYSYKGGTGRTTATSNIASKLAMNGKNVLCIDMDIEGPGLSVLFDLKQNKMIKEGKFLQDYLTGTEFDVDALIDINKNRMVGAKNKSMSSKEIINWKGIIVPVTTRSS